MAVCYEEAAIMALIKSYISTSNKILTYESVKNFEKELNKKLDEFGHRGTGYFKESDREKFFYSRDEYGNGYLVLNSNLELDDLSMTEIMTYPLEYLKALDSYEVLKTINLIKVDGKIVSRSKYYKNLAEKYDLKQELSVERPKFNIFEDWEKVGEDGFIENYCLSDAEKMILQELRKTKTSETEQGPILKKTIKYEY